jgi:hypothetical protein
MVVNKCKSQCLIRALALSMALLLSGTADAQSSPFSLTALVKHGDPDGRGAHFLACDGCTGGLTLRGLNDAGDVTFFAQTDGPCFAGGLFIVSQGRPSTVADFCTNTPFSPFGFLSTGSLNNKKQVVFHAVAKINGQPTPALLLWDGGTLSKVAAVGDPTPAGSDFSGCGFGEPTLNNGGRIAFSGCGTPPAGGGLDLDGVFTGLDGMLRKVVAAGDPSPVGSRFLFGYVPPQEATINDVGDVLFYSSIDPGNPGLRERFGLFASGPDGIRKIAVSEDTLPDGSRIPSFGNAFGDMNNRGDVAFRAPLEGSPANGGIYLYSAGSMSKIARVGEACPGGGAFQGFFDPAGMSLVNDPGINDNGAVVFEAFTKPGRSAGLFMGSPKGLLKVMATGDRAPTGEVIGDMPTFAINRMGQVAFFAVGKSGSPIGIVLATPNPPTVTSVKFKRKTGQLLVNGGPFIVGDSIIEVNGAPLATNEFPADFQSGDGSATRIVSADSELDQLVPPGKTVQITVFNGMTNLRSAPFAFTRP